MFIFRLSVKTSYAAPIPICSCHISCAVKPRHFSYELQPIERFPTSIALRAGSERTPRLSLSPGNRFIRNMTKSSFYTKTLRTHRRLKAGVHTFQHASITPIYNRKGKQNSTYISTGCFKTEQDAGFNIMYPFPRHIISSHSLTSLSSVSIIRKSFLLLFTHKLPCIAHAHAAKPFPPCFFLVPDPLLPERTTRSPPLLSAAA